MHVQLSQLANHLITMACRARDILQCVTMVGLDVEWKPNTSGEQNPASILQVCFIACLDNLCLQTLQTFTSVSQLLTVLCGLHALSLMTPHKASNNAAAAASCADIMTSSISNTKCL